MHSKREKTTATGFPEGCREYPKNTRVRAFDFRFTDIHETLAAVLLSPNPKTRFSENGNKSP